MKKVLVNKPIHRVALERLATEAEVLTPFEAPPEEVMGLLSGVHGLILCAGLQMEAPEMEHCPALEIIARHGVGFDNVDVDAATKRGLLVTYTPTGPTESTAEHAFMLMLAAARQVTRLDGAVRSGDFAIRDRFRGREMKGKSLGVIGFGRIGQRMAEMCRDALHMPVYVYDPYLESEAAVDWGATPVGDVEEMAAMVDVLTIHTPLTDATRHLVSHDVLRALKPGAILINTSRGPVVDEGALIAALEEGHLASAGLDVFNHQPPRESNPLLAMEQVVLTPHVGSATEEGRQRMGLIAVEDVLRALRGERPLNLLNPEVWTSRRTIA
jgi:D-3-phosphoglycerate dehydrogenase